MFNQNSTQDFLELTKSLKMNSGFESANSLIDAHLKQVHALLQDFISNDPLVTEPLRDSLAYLPAVSVCRLVTSPYLCEMLMIIRKGGHRDLTSVRQQIVQGLIAEAKLVNPGASYLASPKWTFDGDVVLDPIIAQRFPALQTSCGIRLNYQSYAHNTGKLGIGGYSYETALKHKERIEYGKWAIRQTSSPAASLVDTFTVAIQFRIDKNRPNIVNSSTATSVGLIRTDNFHKLHSDMPEIVDMLVHESIHQYLHLFEEQLFTFVNLKKVCPESVEDRIYPSPWSGNLLDLRSYTHAILVWYGLWNFWTQVYESGFSTSEMSREQIGLKIQEAEIGFLKPESVLANLGMAQACLSYDYIGQIERIQNEVCESQADGKAKTA